MNVDELVLALKEEEGNQECKPVVVSTAGSTQFEFDDLLPEGTTFEELLLALKQENGEITPPSEQTNEATSSSQTPFCDLSGCDWIEDYSVSAMVCLWCGKVGQRMSTLMYEDDKQCRGDLVGLSGSGTRHLTQGRPRFAVERPERLLVAREVALSEVRKYCEKVFTAHATERARMAGIVSEVKSLLRRLVAPDEWLRCVAYVEKMTATCIQVVCRKRGVVLSFPRLAQSFPRQTPAKLRKHFLNFSKALCYGENTQMDDITTVLNHDVPYYLHECQDNDRMRASFSESVRRRLVSQAIQLYHVCERLNGLSEGRQPVRLAPAFLYFAVLALAEDDLESTHRHRVKACLHFVQTVFEINLNVLYSSLRIVRQTLFSIAKSGFTFADLLTKPTDVDPHVGLLLKHLHLFAEHHRQQVNAHSERCQSVTHGTSRKPPRATQAAQAQGPVDIGHIVIERSVVDIDGVQQIVIKPVFTAERADQLLHMWLQFNFSQRGAPMQGTAFVGTPAFLRSQSNKLYLAKVIEYIRSGIRPSPPPDACLVDGIRSLIEAGFSDEAIVTGRWTTSLQTSGATLVQDGDDSFRTAFTQKELREHVRSPESSKIYGQMLQCITS
eukprot:NODE_953_length_1970_cov_105.051976_g903_i0.p1 GENE.NODE_953_length_1970_cov_105.051976_g903_i0~~NODE_953_length_1970_cov_105.051976_g903_i0.p1  ORF type:complete len:630 (+),score=92.13 NODE_953_length_1970_cov_105.051976_g903_i0:59-1891(+)